MINRSVNLSLLVGLIVLAGCSSSQNESTGSALDPDSTKGLKDYYQDYFPMGVAVYPEALDGPQAALIKKHFVSMTPENVMKMGPIHPKENTYNWAPADRIATFAKENNMMMRGHALCWHNQVPDWIFVDDQGGNVSKEVLLERLRSHIHTVVKRYADVIYAWDVVNEAISDSPDEMYRSSRWYQICGEEYIARAFEYAREADPDVKLFYNDYDVINPVKREKIYKMVKGLVEAGVPIDGVGIQGHWSVYEPDTEVLKETIERFTDLGLEVQITELDVSVYPKEHTRREKRADDDDTFTAELNEKQVAQYDNIFTIFREKKDKLSGVTFWNISDRYSWLDHFPVEGRKDYPLLFDQDLKPKAAYREVVDFD